jgi:uncharacterized protein YecE (DUF72 family)
MDFYVGTSGYSYTKWRGKFYPDKFPADEMLGFYSTKFHSVEINNSFYKLPTSAMVKAWASQVPADFLFVMKAPADITHRKRLSGAKKSLTSFIKVAKVLKERLGPLFFQLPPNFKKNVPLLRDFLESLPSGYRAAFEFRHPSWFDNEVFQLLREYRTALCLADADDDLKIPFEATADWGYLRLRREEYSTAELKKWAKKIKAQTWRECFVFFRHEDEGKGPQYALRLLELLGKGTGAK